MNSWDTSEAGQRARAAATRLFCEHMENNPEDRRACAEPNEEGHRKAKELFAKLGGFYLEGAEDMPEDFKPIPEKTVFRVYNFDPPQERDDLVTIVLPQGKTPPDQEFVAEDYYRCSYWPW